MIKFHNWFAHWCAFQMTALNLNCWKWRFLFHDMEKPFLDLFLPHATVRKIHRKFSRHHVEYIFPKHYDLLAMVIDWECARFTKPDKPFGALETLCTYYPELTTRIVPILKTLKLYK